MKVIYIKPAYSLNIQTVEVIEDLDENTKLCKCAGKFILVDKKEVLTSKEAKLYIELNRLETEIKEKRDRANYIIKELEIIYTI